MLFLAAIASAYSFSRSAVAAANTWSIELDPVSVVPDCPIAFKPSGPTYPYNLYGLVILYFVLFVKSLKKYFVLFNVCNKGFFSSKPHSPPGLKQSSGVWFAWSFFDNGWWSGHNSFPDPIHIRWIT